MPGSQGEAVSRDLPDKALEFGGYKLLNPLRVRAVLAAARGANRLFGS